MIATLEPRVLLANPEIQVTFGNGPIQLLAYHGESLSYTEYSLVNGFDPDGTNVHLVVDTDPQQGTVTLVDGNVNYVPSDAAYVGPDSFSLKYVDDDGEESDSVTVNVELTNSAPSLTVVNSGDPLTASFDFAHDTSIAQDGSFLYITDNESDPATLSVVDQVTHGTLVFNAQTGGFTYTPDPLYVGPDSFTLTADDGFDNGASPDKLTVMLNMTNAAPMANDDYVYSSHSSTVRVRIADLLGNDSDVDDPLDLTSFSLTAYINPKLDVVRDGDELVITPTYKPVFGSGPRDDMLLYKITDRVGAVGYGNLHVINIPMTIKEAWLQSLNEQEAVHQQYRYYSALGIGAAFAQLRSAAEQANYSFAILSPGANAEYLAFENRIVIPNGSTSLDPTTVIHETIHAVDDFNGWYLSDLFGIGRDLDKAERLAWTGQNFLAASSGPLSSLQSFENYAFGTVVHTPAEITERWKYVVTEWSSMPTYTYASPGWTGNSDLEINVAGWTDFFSKFGLSGLSSVAGIYETLCPGAVCARAVVMPGIPPTSKEVPVELW